LGNMERMIFVNTGGNWKATRGKALKKNSPQRREGSPGGNLPKKKGGGEWGVKKIDTGLTIATGVVTEQSGKGKGQKNFTLHLEAGGQSQI